MNSIVQKIGVLRLLSTLTLGLGMSQIFVFPLLADEFVNITDIQGCRVIRGEDERLLCYDTVSAGGVFNEQKVKKMQEESFGSKTMAKPPQTAPVPAPAPATATTTTPSATGSSSTPATSSAPATSSSSDRLSVTVVRSKKDGSGRYYFQTAAGQVWKQVDPIRYADPVPFEAEIKAGLLGTYFLINSGGKSTRVKRVR